jgi:hypothetical protein
MESAFFKIKKLIELQINVKLTIQFISLSMLLRENNRKKTLNLAKN